MATTKKAASKSGNPAKRAAAKASSVSDFKKKKSGIMLQLPTGLWMKVRRISMTSFITQGDVPNPLLPLVEEALNKGKEIDVAELVGDDDAVTLEKVNDILELMNAIVVQMSVEPKVYSVPDDEADRDGDLLYVDELDDEDRMFLFQFAIGGTSDLERFRRELNTGMGTVAEVASSARTTKSASRPRKR